MRSGRSDYTLRNHGSDLTLGLWWDGRNQAVLMVDGVEVDRGSAGPVGRVDLAAGTPHHVRVVWWWRGRPATCALVETAPTADPAGDSPLPRARHHLTPTRATTGHQGPPGARPPGDAPSAVGVATRRRQGRRHRGRRPRHQCGAARVAAPARPPAARTSTSDLPGWVRYLDVGRYLQPVVGWLKETWAWLVPDWLPETGWVKYVVGLLIAINVARAEVKRRSERARREADARAREGAGD